MFNSFFSRRTFHSSCTKAWFWRSQKSSVPALYKVRKEPWLTPTMVLVGVMPVFAFGLGTWQLQRLQWKINLIDELEEKLQLLPLSLPDKIKFSFFFLCVFALRLRDISSKPFSDPRICFPTSF